MTNCEAFTASISDSRALILIGPGKHFGAELIARFAKEGFVIGVVATNESSIAALRQQIGQHIQFEYVIADLTDHEKFPDLVRALACSLPPIQCLIYNPKLSINGNGLSNTFDDLVRSMSVNVTGALLAIQTLLPFLEQAKNARVILTGGGYKDRPHSSKFVLSVGKAGLHGLVRALRVPLSAKGVDLKTVVIDGAIRRHTHMASSHELADFFWNVFNRSGRYVYRFPIKAARDDEQLKFAV
jgi:short-subunit dehydrogenase